MKHVLIPALATLLLAAGTAVAGDHDGPDAVARLVDGNGENIGKVKLVAAPSGTLMRVKVKGLEPGFKAIHIHAAGTCQDHAQGFQASGGHVNPDKRQHGLLNPEGPGSGDLTNFYVHEDGLGRAEIFTSLASLDGDSGARILDDDGAAIVIHENPDNHMDQPIGGAGSRIACGVIRSLQ